jgi:hypothetical protein
LKTALTASAKQSGAKIIEGQYIHHLKTEGMEIQSVMMNGGEELTGDKFMLDHDPVWFFRDYLKGIKLSPAFKNRIIPKQNTKECARAVVALSSMPDQSIVDKLNTITGNDITTARNDLKKEGGAQMPVLSVVAITHNGVDMIDILAHYFDPTLEDTTPVIDAIKRALGADIESLITSITLQPTPSQCGNPNFISTMPLLQLFKIFFGHHSLAYDNPVQNLMICGYGNYAVSHPHVRRGGERVATLLQSL